MLDQKAADDQPDLTVKEVAARLRISRFTVYRMLRAGDFRGAYRLRGAYRIPEAVLTAWIAENEVGD